MEDRETLLRTRAFECALSRRLNTLEIRGDIKVGNTLITA